MSVKRSGATSRGGERASGEVALEAAHRLARALALAHSAGDVGLGGRVAAPREHDRVQRPVQAAVAAAIEPVADSLAGAGRKRSRTGQAGTARLAARPPAVGPGTEERRRRHGADAAAVEQLRPQSLDAGRQLGFECGRLGTQLAYPAGERAQRQGRGEALDIGGAGPQAGAPAKQGGLRQSLQGSGPDRRRSN
jgi:hypothetical protein